MARFSETHQLAGRNGSDIKGRLFSAFIMVNHGRWWYRTCRHGPQRNVSKRHRPFFARAGTIEFNIEIRFYFMVVYEGTIGTQRGAGYNTLARKVTCEYEWVTPTYQQTDKSGS